jgi:hypothetical protein
MRFIKGDNLKEAIRRFHEADKPDRDPGERSLALRQLLRRFVDVCNAVAYAHSRGVLHRRASTGSRSGLQNRPPPPDVRPRESTF